jgi:hypothetical protein
MVGSNTDEHALSREVGIGSKSQYLLGDVWSTLAISSGVAGRNSSRLAGVVGGGGW